MNTSIRAAILLAATSLAVTACSGEADEVEAPAAADTIAGLQVTNARMMLPPVAGNPAAVYFDLAYSGDRNLALRSASVEGAGRAQMHDMMEYNREMTMGEMPPLMLQPGDSASFAPGGKHVMVYDLGPGLVEGGTARVSLTAAGGRKHSFDAAIRPAGDER